MIRSLASILAIAHLCVAAVPCAGAGMTLPPAQDTGESMELMESMEDDGSMHRHGPQREAATQDIAPRIKSQCMCGCDQKSNAAPAGYARLGVSVPPADLVALAELRPAPPQSSCPLLPAGYTRAPDTVPIPS
jgi:hypothetical protein